MSLSMSVSMSHVRLTYCNQRNRIANIWTTIGPVKILKSLVNQSSGATWSMHTTVIGMLKFLFVSTLNSATIINIVCHLARFLLVFPMVEVY